MCRGIVSIHQKFWHFEVSFSRMVICASWVCTREVRIRIVIRNLISDDWACERTLLSASLSVPYAGRRRPNIKNQKGHYRHYIFRSGKWDNITMDFLIVRVTYSLKRFARLYIYKIVWLPRVLNSIVLIKIYVLRRNLGKFFTRY